MMNIANRYEMSKTGGDHGAYSRVVISRTTVKVAIQSPADSNWVIWGKVIIPTIRLQYICRENTGKTISHRGKSGLVKFSYFSHLNGENASNFVSSATKPHQTAPENDYLLVVQIGSRQILTLAISHSRSENAATATNHPPL
jgi:hypothetical protein